MALRQLAGPINLVSNTGVPLPYAVGGLYWYEGVGLVTVYSGGMGTIAFDGVYESIRSSAPQLIGFWPSRRLLVTMEVVGGHEYSMEPKAFIAKQVAEGLYSGIFPFGHYVRLQDRRIFFANNYVQKLVNGQISLDSPLLVVEGHYLASGHLQVGRYVDEVLIVENGGDHMRCCFYNTVTKAVPSKLYHLSMAAEDVVYAPELGVFISLHSSPRCLRVWATEVAPHHLSTVQLIAGEAQAGRVATYRVQALGSFNEPCENELIDWSVVGDGTLLDVQDKTDSSGYATTKVAYGLDADGDSVVTASLRC